MKLKLSIIFFSFSLFNGFAQENILIHETDSIKLFETYISLNTTENLFPAVYGDGLIYTSRDKTTLYHLYYSDLQSKSTKIKISSKFSLGSVAFFENEIYFTGKSKSVGLDFVNNSTIYKGVFDNLKVSKIHELAFCNKFFDYSYPAISKEGDYMVVITNENGSSHLLALNRNENNEWERGEVIFIAQENFILMNPTIFNKNTIYFASNFFNGAVKEVKRNYEKGKLAYIEIFREKGVFNIYKIVKVNGIWQLPQRVTVFNSEFDDLGVIFKTEKSGYLTTFRYNDTDNLYYFELK